MSRSSAAVGSARITPIAPAIAPPMASTTSVPEEVKWTEPPWMRGARNHPSSNWMIPNRPSARIARSGCVARITGKEMKKAIHGPMIGTISPTRAITPSGSHTWTPIRKYPTPVMMPTMIDSMITPRVYEPKMRLKMWVSASASPAQARGNWSRICRVIFGSSIRK